MHSTGMLLPEKAYWEIDIGVIDVMDIDIRVKTCLVTPIIPTQVTGGKQY